MQVRYLFPIRPDASAANLTEAERAAAAELDRVRILVTICEAHGWSTDPSVLLTAIDDGHHKLPEVEELRRMAAAYPAGTPDAAFVRTLDEVVARAVTAIGDRHASTAFVADALRRLAIVAGGNAHCGCPKCTARRAAAAAPPTPPAATN